LKTVNRYAGGCGAAIYTGQRLFQQAVNITSREENWEHRKLKGGMWRNYCPQCAGESDLDPDLAGYISSNDLRVIREEQAADKVV